MEYELKIITATRKRKWVTWDGSDGLKACASYADAHREATVLAWRHVRHGLFIGTKNIIE